MFHVPFQLQGTAVNRQGPWSQGSSSKWVKHIDLSLHGQVKRGQRSGNTHLRMLDGDGARRKRAPWIVAEGYPGRGKRGHECCFESVRRETSNACPSYPQALDGAE